MQGKPQQDHKRRVSRIIRTNESFDMEYTVRKHPKSVY